MAKNQVLTKQKRWVFSNLHCFVGTTEAHITTAFSCPDSCPDKSESLGFPIIGMKFDVVTQWVIAYDQLVIYPFAGLAVG